MTEDQTLTVLYRKVCLFHCYYKLLCVKSFWAIKMHSPLKINLRFELTCDLHLQSQRINEARNQREASLLATCFTLVSLSACYLLHTGFFVCLLPASRGFLCLLATCFTLISLSPCYLLHAFLFVCLLLTSRWFLCLLATCFTLVSLSACYLLHADFFVSLLPASR
jgi:hypothetical protein